MIIILMASLIGADRPAEAIYLAMLEFICEIVMLGVFIHLLQ